MKTLPGANFLFVHYLVVININKRIIMLGKEMFATAKSTKKERMNQDILEEMDK